MLVDPYLRHALLDRQERSARALAAAARRSADQRAIVTVRARALVAEHLITPQPVRRGSNA